MKRPWNTKAKQNGRFAEQYIAEKYGHRLVLGNHDAEKDIIVDGQKKTINYEYKSCQCFITDGNKIRKGRFILEDKDFQGDKMIIFALFDKQKLIWIGEVHNSHLKPLQGLRNISQNTVLTYIFAFGRLYEK